MDDVLLVEVAENPFFGDFQGIQSPFPTSRKSINFLDLHTVIGILRCYS